MTMNTMIAATLIAGRQHPGGLGAFAQAAQAAVDGYADRYRAYFERNNAQADPKKVMLDPMPRVILVPGLGLFGAGRSRKDAVIAADIAETASGGYLLYDSSWPLDPDLERGDVNFLGVPLATICLENFAKPRERILMKNIVYAGAIVVLFLFVIMLINLEQNIRRISDGRFWQFRTAASKSFVEYARARLSASTRPLIR